MGRVRSSLLCLASKITMKGSKYKVVCGKMVYFFRLTTQSGVCLQAIRFTHEHQSDLFRLPFLYFLSH